MSIIIWSHSKDWKNLREVGGDRARQYVIFLMPLTLSMPSFNKESLRQKLWNVLNLKASALKAARGLKIHCYFWKPYLMSFKHPDWYLWDMTHELIFLNTYFLRNCYKICFKNYATVSNKKIKITFYKIKWVPEIELCHLR